MVNIEDNRFTYTMVYHVPKPTEKSLRTELQFFKYISRGKNYAVDNLEKSVARFTTFELEMTVMEMKKKIYGLIRGCFKEEIKDDEQLNT